MAEADSGNDRKTSDDRVFRSERKYERNEVESRGFQ